MRPVQVYDWVMAPTPERRGPIIRRPIYEGKFLEFGLSGAYSKAIIERQLEEGKSCLELIAFSDFLFLDTREAVKSKPKNGDVPFQDIIDVYHEILPMLGRVRVLTSHRKQQMQRRWNNEFPDLEAWRSYFQDVAKSRFLTGQALNVKNPGWKADIDWLLKPGNVAKVSEGKYH